MEPPVETPPEPTRTQAPSGAAVDPLPPGLRPAAIVHEGRYARLEPLDPRLHADELFAAGHGSEAADRVWDYLGYGPFASVAALREWARGNAASADPLFFAIRDLRTGNASGVATLMNIVPLNATIEIGHIWLGPALQNTAAATEALFLLIDESFKLGYRRMEWKCNALNAPSRRAAVRLGFRFEGIFYQHMISKGRNRDTAWFSILDGEWPRLRANFERWLDPANFDDHGRQRLSLGEMNRADS